METPNQNQPQIQQNIVVVKKQKSVGVAFLLAFLFGPLGLLYASVTGGIVMFILGIIIGIVTLGFGLIFVWIGSIIWAIVSANNANKNIGTGLKINTNFEGNSPTHQQPQAKIIENTKSIVEDRSQQYQSSNPSQSSFDLAKWFDTNKKSMLIGSGGIVGILLMIIAIKFVFSIDFSQDSPNTAQSNDDSFKEITTTTAYVSKEIPKPTVPIVKATNVLPKWTQSEDLDGDYILIGLYVGAIGKKPIKISIIGVDTTSNHVIGFSSVNNNRVDFEGTYDVRFRKATTNQASNIINFNTYVFSLTLFEPDGINTNGVFQLQFEITDAQGSSGNGSWTSYNGKLYREIKVLDTYLAQEIYF